MVNDLRYSVLRYFYGNFSDGHRQDSLDLISGSYNFNTSLLEAYPKQQKSSFSAILPILFLSLLMILIGDLFFLTSSLQDRLIFAILIVVGMIFIAKYIFRHPQKYVDLPLLISLNNRDKFNKFKGKN
uniref:Phosphoinositide phosphatase SAC1 (Trinotate prediction) n=1 Tax=Myxobolus squamalis TaxID=59785 RepID=A0A6B2FZW3_MYXSQ